MFYLQKLFKVFPSSLIALKDDFEITRLKCAMESNMLFWYKDETVAEKTMLAVNTWAYRNHGCDDKRNRGLPRCFNFYKFSTAIKDPTKIGFAESLCYAINLALCQVTGMRYAFAHHMHC